MQLEITHSLYKYLIICNIYKYVQALVGINIRQAQENEFLFSVAIVQVQNENPYQFFKLCMGTLVTKSDVLTAEHCVLGRNLSRVEIIGGSINITCGINYKLYWWLTYDQWITRNRRQLEFPKNDVAMLRLLTDVASHIIPAPISYVANNVFYGLEVLIPSWSRTERGQLVNIMEVGPVKVLSHTYCAQRMRRFREQNLQIPERLLCTAASPPILLASGDSGGPLLFQSMIIAINSGTIPDIQPIYHAEKMNLHFGVDYYREFILDAMNNL